MAKRFLPKLSLIGAGTVGSTLALALFDQGYRFASIISRTGKPAMNLAKAVQCTKVSTSVTDINPASEVILICVADKAIAEIAVELARLKTLKHKALFVAHTSGVHSADILRPLQKKGSMVASIHPIQTFPAGQRRSQLRSRLRGISYGVDGESNACSRAEQLVADLGGRALRIPSEMKPLYHVACVFASSYLAANLNAITELSRTLELRASWMETFGPLMTATMENVIADSAPKALTGPILRGDHETLKLHLDAISAFAPQFLPLYTVGGIEIARIARDHGSIATQEFKDIVTLFRTFVKSTSAPHQPKRPH